MWEDRMRKETIYSLKYNGVGFDERDANKLSAVVQRLRRAEEYEGTGVGLSIINRKIDRATGIFGSKGRVAMGPLFILLFISKTLC
jgi:light-regulated signal transduction histidine kinase (bacteriophytochrome)